MPEVFMQAHRVPIILAAARNSVPAVYGDSVFARDGGLLSYASVRATEKQSVGNSGAFAGPIRNIMEYLCEAPLPALRARRANVQPKAVRRFCGNSHAKSL